MMNNTTEYKLLNDLAIKAAEAEKSTQAHRIQQVATNITTAQAMLRRILDSQVSVVTTGSRY